MSVKNRYIFLKRTYPKTIIIFRNKDNKLISYNNDKELLKFINFKKIKDLNKLKINYIIVSNNMFIEEFKLFTNNNYDIFLGKCELLNIIDYIQKNI